MTDVVRRAGGATLDAGSLVTADQASILGDGSRDNPLRAGAIAADQSTILGSGTRGDPLRAGLAGGSFRARFRGGSIVPAPGIPVFSSLVASPGELMVQPTDIRAADPALTSARLFASTLGVVAGVREDGSVDVQSAGFLTLPVAQWDLIAGGTLGLTPGLAYYAAKFPRVGLTTSPSTDPGDFVTRVGTALSPTTLLLTPSAPVQNLADSIVFAGFTGAELLLGQAVFVDAAEHVDLAVNNVSLAHGQVLGVVAAIDVGGRPIVQFAGRVTLSPERWQAVTDTVGGLLPGFAYFVDSNLRPGRLTGSMPTAAPVVVAQVGVAFSTTDLILSTPSSLIRIS